MSARLLALSAYVALGLVMAGLELAAWRTTAVPRFAELVSWAARKRSARFGLLLVWWWLGWHFVLGI